MERESGMSALSSNVWTAYVRRTADVLLLKNPLGTSIGLFAGLATHGLLQLFAPLLQRYSLAVGHVLPYHCMALGIVACNVPNILRRRKLAPSIEDAFELIARL